ncbi:MAG TPA: AAA family ATPase [Thermoanaerobaculia bacterium]|nr:AAA family ATPase [Thermoanaerobaculia bacterium]
MYVRSLRIQNLRCFEEAEVQLHYPGKKLKGGPDLPNVNLLLGNNGVGKTTVLKATALGVLERILASSGLKPDHLVRRRKAETKSTLRGRAVLSLLLHPEDLAGVEAPSVVRSSVRVTKFKDYEWFPSAHERAGDEAPPGERIWNELFNDDSPAFFLVGYGSTRFATGASEFEPLPSQRKRRSLRYQRVAGLFEDFVGLTPLSLWLPRTASEDPGRFLEVVDLLNDLLPDEARFSGEIEKDEYLFEHCGIPVPLGALSDGYRAYVGWISDLLYNTSLGAPKGTRLRDARGVVLVDEIDLHLHPEWQREVVPTVARTFPNLQFVLTTHSPIVAGTLSAQNIFVLEMDGSGASTIRQFEEPIHGLNADQILVSSYFGLDTTRAPGAENELRQLSRKAMSGDSAAAVSFLKKLASGTDPSR